MARRSTAVEPEGTQPLENLLQAALSEAISKPRRQSSTIDLGGLEKVREALLEVTAPDAAVPLASRVLEASVAMRA